MTARRRTLVINVALAAVLVAVGVTGYLLLSGSPAGAQATSTRTVAARTGDVAATVSATGNLAAVKQVAANFDTTGTVTAVKVSVGDKVSKGDVLARLDTNDSQRQVTQAEASLSSAEAQLDKAREGTTSTEMATGKSTTTIDESQVAQAEAQVVQADSDLDQARQALSDTTLISPISGTVLEVNGIVGSSSSGTSSSATGSGSTDFIVVADLQSMQLAVSFTEADISSVKAGQKATITFPAADGVTATGKVVSIDPNATVSDSIVTYGAVVRLTAVPKTIRLGQTAEATITTDSATDVLVVPTLAITARGDTSTVTVVKDGVATATVVETGVAGDTYTEITSGLAEGDQVQLDLSTTDTSTSSDQLEFGGGPAGGPTGANP